MQKCVVCDKNTFLIKYRISKGGVICRKCFRNIPLPMAEFSLSRFSQEDFKSFLSCKEKSDEELKPVFKSTVSYGDFKLDTVDKLLYISPIDLIVELRDFPAATFVFEYKEDSGHMDFLLDIKTGFPLYRSSYVLLRDIEIKEEVNEYSSGNDFSKYLPDDLKRFKDEFYKAYKDAKLNALEKGLSEKMGRPIGTLPKMPTMEDIIQETSGELLDAIHLFGYESVEYLTLEKLNRRREILLKPSSVTLDAYKEHVNKAYRLLQKLVMERDVENRYEKK